MFERLRERYAVWRRYRHTVHQLSIADSYTLRDAGIDPRSIHSVAMAAARRPVGGAGE
jgi:uncharacterized protein YjiS (DUF1127 family)